MSKSFPYKSLRISSKNEQNMAFKASKILPKKSKMCT